MFVGTLKIIQGTYIFWGMTKIYLWALKKFRGQLEGKKFSGASIKILWGLFPQSDSHNIEPAFENKYLCKENCNSTLILNYRKITDNMQENELERRPLRG